jgi:Ca2+-binding EF-hand superfamily protein
MALQSELQKAFKLCPPSETLVYALHNRFRKLKFTTNGDDIDKKTDMDILDFLIAMNLLTRHSNEEKLKLLFQLCDDDNDGCMRPAEILQMLQRVERIFAWECSKVNIQSVILLNNIADKKAEINFHYIMNTMRQEQQKSNIADQALIEEDNLIDYTEFSQAVSNFKQKDYYKLLPRTLSFNDVLDAKKLEDVYEITDLYSDNFSSFRYQLSTIFRKHHFLDDDDEKSEFYGGKHPLSRYQGEQIKDLNPEQKKACIDMYKPPGFLVEKPSELGHLGFRSSMRA